MADILTKILVGAKLRQAAALAGLDVDVTEDCTLTVHVVATFRVADRLIRKSFEVEEQPSQSQNSRLFPQK